MSYGICTWFIAYFWKEFFWSCEEDVPVVAGCDPAFEALLDEVRDWFDGFIPPTPNEVVLPVAAGLVGDVVLVQSSTSLALPVRHERVTLDVNILSGSEWPVRSERAFSISDGSLDGYFGTDMARAAYLAALSELRATEVRLHVTRRAYYAHLRRVIPILVWVRVEVREYGEDVVGYDEYLGYLSLDSEDTLVDDGSDNESLGGW